MRIRTFEALVGRKLNVENGDSDGPFKFKLESIVGNVALLSPVDRRSSNFARDAKRESDITIVGFVEDGILRAGSAVDRWSERSGALRVRRPDSMTFTQRRRTVRLPARLDMEVAAMRDGEMYTTRAQSMNISIGGFAAAVSEMFTEGEELMVHLKLPNGSISIVAEVTLMESLRQRIVHARTTNITPDDYDTLLQALLHIEDDLARIGIRL